MIDWFMNGKVSKKKPKKNKDPLSSLMLKPSKGSIIGDMITKPQRKVLKKKNTIMRFADWDGDGVINGLDCRPRNRKKHNYRKRLKNTPDYLLDDIDFNNKYRYYSEKEVEPLREGRKRGHIKYDPRYNQSDIRKVQESARKPGFFSDTPQDSPIHKYVAVNDHITPEQKEVLQSGQDRFTDTDGDGVVDGLDCKPNDKTQHMAFKEKSGVPIVDSPSDFGYSSRKVMMTPKMFMREARASNQAWDMTDEEYEKNTVTKYRYPEERDKAVNERGVDPKELDNYIEYKKEYMGKLSNAIKDKEPKVPTGYIEYDDRGFPKDHEGRHRAIAARDVGMKEIPVYIVNKETDDEGNPKTYYGKNPKDSKNWGD